MDSNSWTVLRKNDGKVKYIKDLLKAPEFISRILVNRNIDDNEKALNYIKPNIYHLYSPFLFQDMSKAILRINRSIDEKKAILIFGDKDVDGITSTAILYKILQKIGANVVYRVPERMESYGLSRDVIAWAIMQSFDLIITVDCGITAINEVEYANKMGVDIIITDHHEPRDELPKAYAVINPKVKQDSYPFPYLCGAGVTFKLAQALIECRDLPGYFDEEIIFFDLETSGLNPNRDEIIEIGAVKVKNGVTIQELQILIKPSNPISPKITEITNITNEMLEKDGVSIDTALEVFVKFIGDKKIVGHNIVGFDLKFINENLKKLKKAPLNNLIEDTLKISKVMIKKIKDHKLSTVAADLGIYTDPKKLHRSLKDSEVCAKIYRRLLISKSARIDDLFKEYLPLAAIGTIADIMPLIDENRNIVKNGLKYISYSPIGLISVLRKLNQPIDHMSSKAIGWNVSPILNSAGRMGNASLSVELLVSNKLKDAENIAKEIIKMDKERKNILRNNLDIAMEKIDSIELEKAKIIIIASEKINKGISGLIASKISNKFQIPTVIISIDGDESTGSMRISGEMDIVRMFESMNDVFEQYGGHKYAGGFTLKTDMIDVFTEKAVKYMEDFDKKDLKVGIVIDIELEDLEELSLNNIRYMESIIEPTGNFNESPNFLIKNVLINHTKFMGKNEEHVLITIKKDQLFQKVLAWNSSERIKDLLNTYSSFDIVGSPEINRFQGKEDVRLVLVDIKGNRSV